MLNKIDKNTSLINFFNRLAVIEQENRKIQGEITEILNQTKPDETELTKPADDSTDNSPQFRTGRRRVPG
jgi:Asp-tRNA(Asn)/Glu-tRNA(Gln) amidotransferase C subunit